MCHFPLHECHFQGPYANARSGEQLLAWQQRSRAPSFHSPEVDGTIHATDAIAGARQQAVRGNINDFLSGLGVRFM